MSPSAQHNPRYDIVAPVGLHVEPLGGHPFLGPLSAVGEVIYRIGSSTLGRLRASRRERVRTGATVVSVGNIEVGGNGKTPFAVHLLGHLVEAGHSPVYISRGFRGVAERLDAVTVLAPEGSDAAPPAEGGVRFVTRGSPGLATEIGDEGAMVAMRCPAVPLLFAKRRARGIAVAGRMFKPSHVVLDDAFQTWSVGRDIDVVLLDAREPFANGRLLPAGRLREAPQALRRADAVGLNGYDDSIDLAAFGARLERLCDRPVPVFGVYRGIDIVDAVTGDDAVPAGPVGCVSSIARPERFERELLARGLDLRVAIRYPDHYRYDPGAVGSIKVLLERRGVRTLVTTEKDWVKLRDLPRPASGIMLARLGLRLTTPSILRHIEKPQARPAAF